MNKIILSFILWLMVAISASAETKIEATFDIKKAWADEQSLYILFEKAVTKISHSKLNIDGTVVSEKKHIYLKKFNKSVLAKEIDLNIGGTLIAAEQDSLSLGYYVDSNILIIEKSGLTSISSGGKKADFHCDHARWGEAIFPIKFGSDIFYCGLLFSTLTGELKQFSSNVQGKFQSMITTTSYYSGTLLAAAEGRNLLVTRYRTAFTEKIKPTTPEILRVQIDSMNADVVNNPSMSLIGYWPLHPEEAYSTEGFSLRDDAQPAKAVLCGVEKCKEILGIPYYKYIVVDATSNFAFFMNQHAPTESVINIEAVRYE